MTITTLKRLLLSLLLAVYFGDMARAEVYPTRLIKIVAPSSAGGGVDWLARLLADHFQRDLGQPVIVEDRPGAGTILGLDYVAKADPDGYTIAVEATELTTLDALHDNVPFNALTDFAPIGLIAKPPVLIATHPSVPATTFQELIAWAQKQNGLNYTSCGVGTPQHLAGELLKVRAHINMVHISYKGCAPAIVDVLGGQIPILIGTVGALNPLISAGKLRGYAITSAERSPLAPNMPTVAESGYPGFVVDSWFGLLAPAKTPPDVIAKLNAELNKTLSDPGTKEKLASQAFEPIGGTSDRFSQLIRADHERLGKLIRDLGIKP